MRNGKYRLPSFAAHHVGKFDEIVAFAEVEQFLDTPVKRYSSGMYVRLAFAVAAHLEPEILIVDEVLAVGDAQFQKKCLGKMQDVSANEGRTVLFVSHNILAIKSLCTTGILMDNGKVKFLGSIDQSIGSYHSELSPVLIRTFQETDAKTGNELVRLLGIEIEIESNEEPSSAIFLITQEIKIHVLFTNLAIASLININLFFNSPDGTNIFVTCSVPSLLPIGANHLTCIIPPNYLNDNIYSIDVMMVAKDENILFVREAIVLEGAEPPRQSSWLGKFPGYLRPNFSWTQQ